MWHFVLLGYWDHLDRALKRYRSLNLVGHLESFSVQVLEGFMLLYKDASTSEGLWCLQTACEDLERTHLKEPNTIQLYLNALQQRHQFQPDDSVLRQKLEGARTWLDLGSGLIN